MMTNQIILHEDLTDDFRFFTDHIEVVDTEEMYNNREMFRIYHLSIIKNVFIESLMFGIEFTVERLKEKHVDNNCYTELINSIRNTLMDPIVNHDELYNKLIDAMIFTINDKSKSTISKIDNKVVNIFLYLFGADPMISIYAKLKTDIEFYIWESIISSIIKCASNNIKDICVNTVSKYIR